MENWNEDPEEFVDIPDENLEDIADEYLSEKEPDIPDVSWKEDIENIPDHVIREREIERAEDIVNREKGLDEKFKSGKITGYQYWAEYDTGIQEEKIEAITRCSLESIGLTEERFGREITDKVGDRMSDQIDRLDTHDRIDKMIEFLGPEEAQNLAEDLYRGGRLPKKTYDIFSHKASIHEK